MSVAHSKEHVVLWGVAQAGPDGISREALLGRNDMLNRARSGNGPIQMLVKQLGSVKKAEQTMKDDVERDEAAKRYLGVVIQELVKRGRLVEEEGVLRLGVMPRGYDPLSYELKQTRGSSVQNLRNGRKRVKGWTYFVNPELDETIVSQMAAQMARTGWPKGSKVLLDSDGDVADGKHRVAAAERVGIDWTVHTTTIKDEIQLWEEVLQRNLNRWSLSKGAKAKAYTRFLSLRPDLSLAEKITVLREGMNGMSERTQQRATSATKAALKKEQADEFAARKEAGESLRGIADATGVSKDTVARSLKENELSQKRQDGENETPGPSENGSGPKVVGPCLVCGKEVHDEEPRIDVREAKPGFRIGAPYRRKGGANAWAGPFVKVGDAHLGCIDEEAQIAYRNT
jgi:hypothetical protein